MKINSPVPNKYTKAKGTDPKTTFKSDEYATRQLRKLIRLWGNDDLFAINELLANVRKRMGWEIKRPPPLRAAVKLSTSGRFRGFKGL